MLGFGVALFGACSYGFNIIFAQIASQSGIMGPTIFFYRVFLMVPIGLLILLAGAAGPVAPATAIDTQELGRSEPGRSALGGPRPDRALDRAWGASLALCALLGLAYLAGPLWVPLIQDPELPTLPAGILASGRLTMAAASYLLAAALGWGCRRRVWPLPLLMLQLPLVAFVPLVLLPLWNLGDQLRGAPVRAMAEAVRLQLRPGESVAMVGILKPSLHYYSRRVVLYEGTPPEGPINLADRLRRERRAGQLSKKYAKAATIIPRKMEKSAPLSGP
jgi:hypothetical protein